MSDLDDYSPLHTHWFGEAWPYPRLPAPVCAEERYRIPTPVGMLCEMGCGQPIEASDSGVRQAGSQYLHVECFLRSVMCPWNMGIWVTPHVHTDDRRGEGRAILEWSRHLTVREADELSRGPL